MQLIRKTISVLLLLTFLLSAFAVFPATAADPSTNTEARYTQKIVTVVYDNSGSMAAGQRIPAAKYSLSMLMSLLDERDEMIIIPMNKSPNGGISVDLGNPDRDKVLNDIIGYSVLNYQYGKGTPSSSLKTAVSTLASRGLKDSDHLIESEPDKEYWLVVLTDGLFEDNADPSYQADRLVDAVDRYPTLHTVYVSFGSGAIDISGQSKLNKYQLSTYCQVPETPTNDGRDDLVAVMQKISNQISGRYPLKNNQYTASGNSVTIDLSQIPFSLSSLSVIAQDCGATIESVSYNNADPDSGNSKVNLQKVCTVRPDSSLGIRAGCTFEVVSDTYLYGGSLTLQFSGDVNPEKLSIIAEPALGIDYYFEAQVDGQWKRVDVNYINNNLSKKDSIRVGYEVLEQVNNTPIDLEKVFGDVKSKILYNQITYKTGEEIPLVVGTNEISIEVSVMDGAYTLRNGEILTIQEDPTYFRIEVQGDTTVSGSSPTTSPIFTVYVDNLPATKDKLADYVCTAVATASDGTVLFDKEVSPSGDGRITVPLSMETNKFDVYTITLTVKSPQYLTRTASHSVTYVPSSLDLTIEGNTSLSITQYDLKSNTQGFTFALSANGQPFPFINGLTEHKVLINNVDVTDSVTVSGNTLVYIPTEQNLQGLHRTPGDYQIQLLLTSTSYPNLNTDSTVSITIIKTVYTVVPIPSTQTGIHRLDLKNSNAALYFSVQRDGIAFTENDMKTALANGDFDIDADSMFTSIFLPAALSQHIEIVDGIPVLAVTVTRDMGTYLDWHLSAFITGGDKEITVLYSGAEAAQSFTVLPANVASLILRIVLTILVILWLLHLIPFVISLFVAKPIPRGTVVYFNGSQVDLYDINVNIFKRILLFALWILVRFLCPGLEFIDQKLWFQDPGLAEFELKYNRRDGLHFTPFDPETYFKAKVRSNQHANLNRYCNAIADGQQLSLVEFLNRDPKEFSLLTYFDKDGKTALRNDAASELSGGRYFGIFGMARDNSIRLYQVIVFVTF
ncbi:MAG: hypothetical protein E7618_04250 [Ruminococcaceae bacterium]|nr:hypothetical protein [Oscillospiraceae bacterium]